MTNESSETEAEKSTPHSLQNGASETNELKLKNLKKVPSISEETDQLLLSNKSEVNSQSVNVSEDEYLESSVKVNGNSSDIVSSSNKENEANYSKDKVSTAETSVLEKNRSVSSEDSLFINKNKLRESDSSVANLLSENTSPNETEKFILDEVHANRQNDNARNSFETNSNSVTNINPDKGVVDKTGYGLCESKSNEASQSKSNSNEDELMPPSPASETSSHLSLEERLLKCGDNEGEDHETDEALEKNLLEGVDLEKEEESLLLNEVERNFEADLAKSLKSQKSENDIGNKGKEDSEEVTQQKEIEKILKNLDNSLKKSKSKVSDKSSDNDVDETKNEESSSVPLMSKNESNSDFNTLNDTSTVMSERSNVRANSLPAEGESDNSKSEKRSLPSSLKEGTESNESNTAQKKMKNKENELSDKNSTEINVNDKRSSPVITFREALKSIELENPLYVDKPKPLQPTAEIPSDEVARDSASLTDLTPVKANANESASPTPQVKNALESDDQEGQRKKRRLQDSEAPSSDGPRKPDLKKVRVFEKKSEEASKKNSYSNDVVELSKKMEETQSMESRLSEEKKNVEKSKWILEKELEKKDQYTDKEELERRTAFEIRSAGLATKKLKRIKRKDLESLVMELFVDKVLYEHQLGQQKDLCKRLEGTLEANRKKAAQFHKEIEDLKKVTQRLQAEHAARKKHIVAPVKVKRSVGIQATPTIIGKGLMHASTFSNIKVLSPTSGCTSQVSQTAEPQYSNNQKSSLSQTTSTSTPLSANSQSSPNIVPTTTARLHNTSQSQTSSSPQPTSQPSTSPAPHMVMLNPLVVQQQNQNAMAARIARGSGSAVNPNSPAALNQSSPTNQGNPKSNTFIDLTDDDDAAKTARAAAVPPGGILAAIPKSASVGLNQGASGQFVTLNPPSSGPKLVLVPSTLGQPTTALVVGSVANNTQVLSTGITRSSVVPPPSTVRFSTPTSNMVNTSRVLVGPQMNGNSFVAQIPRHPAPLPRAPPQQTSGYSKKLPPVPLLKLSHKDNSIVLSWNMAKTDEHEKIASYQLYAYQEGTAPPNPTLWKKVGSVKALELPMACTLTQFMPGHVYHFAVRAVDIRSRLGPFSDPRSIRLEKHN